MKIQRTYSWVLWIAVLLNFTVVGCKKETNQGPHKGVVILSDSTISVDGDKDTYTINVIANQILDIKSNVDWITFADTAAVGEKQWSQFSFSVTINEEQGDRTGLITFSTAKGEHATLKVIQASIGENNIYVKEDGSSSEDAGFSWENATTLKNALNRAVDGVTIHVAAGTYHPLTTVTDGDPSDNGDKTFEINDHIVIIGGYPANATDEGVEPDPEQNATVLAGENTAYHVVTIASPSASETDKVVLNGLTITGGNGITASGYVTIDGARYNRNQGGGLIIAHESNVELINCQIIDNKSNDAGGLYMTQTSRLKMVNCKVNGNYAERHAAGMYVRTDAKVTLSDCEIRANEADNNTGGIYVYSNSEINIYNSVIADNQCNIYGGGLYVRGSSVGNLVNVIISNNLSDNDGGGVFLYDDSRLNVISSTIVNNTASDISGGIYLRNGKNTATIINSIISGNKQSNQGDIGVDDDNQEVIVKSSAISEKVYDNNGNEMADVDFTFSTMMNDLGDGVFVPVGGDNPARKYGLTASALINIGHNLDPPVEKDDILSEDLNHNTRNENIMGAVVQ